MGMCVDSDDFKPTAIAKSQYTCAQMGTHMLSVVGRTQWRDLTCVDMAESGLLSVDPAGQKSNVYSLLEQIGANCCGSAEDTRSVTSMVSGGKCGPDYKPLWNDADGIVVKFANTLEGYTKDTFTSTVQDAYKKAVASEVGVLASAVKIFRIKDGHEPASASLVRRLAGGHAAVSFDVEIA